MTTEIYERLRTSAIVSTAQPQSTTSLARFLLEGPVLPCVTDTLRVAEAFRHRLLKSFQRQCHWQKYGHAGAYRESFRSEVLAGKDAEGRVLQEHRHAFYLPTAEGSDPRWLTHVTVTAEAGFGPDEVAALSSLRTLALADDTPELRLQLIGLGQAHDFRAPLLQPATVWVSATPFLASRYPKRRGTKRDRPEDCGSPELFARHVLGQELRQHRRLPEVVAIEPLESIGPACLRPIQFQRCRSKRGDDGGRRASGAFRITFASPVSGPLCVGHSCHFGLGLFVPGKED